jgi:Xaa-Pro dipeptidase
MSDTQKAARIHDLLAEAGLDAIVTCDPHNLRWLTGVWLPTSHAQTDLPLFALARRTGAPALVLPESLAESARETAGATTLLPYGNREGPLDAALAALAAALGTARRIGLDAGAATVDRHQAIVARLAAPGCTLTEIGEALLRARSVKTAAEIEVLSEIALRTDHAINGYFHHLIANRATSALVIAEGLRIHALERDIELSGYAACARATVGKDAAEFWAYAPNYDFASAGIRKYPQDLLVAEAANPAAGYWSNAIRLAINAKEMTPEQDAAYGALHRLTTALRGAMRPGRRLCDVDAEIRGLAAAEGIALVPGLALGFGIGVAPMEGPWILPAAEDEIAPGMVFVLDPAVRHGGLLYRSRDTVVIEADGARVVNAYKDWREPYLAIGNLADFT